jgi:hypothetical protein
MAFVKSLTGDERHALGGRLVAIQPQPPGSRAEDVFADL